jgi:hypothetical protein
MDSVCRIASLFLESEENMLTPRMKLGESGTSFKFILVKMKLGSI